MNAIKKQKTVVAKASFATVVAKTSFAMLPTDLVLEQLVPLLAFSLRDCAVLMNVCKSCKEAVIEYFKNVKLLVIDNSDAMLASCKPRSRQGPYRYEQSVRFNRHWLAGCADTTRVRIKFTASWPDMRKRRDCNATVRTKVEEMQAKLMSVARFIWRPEVLLADVAFWNSLVCLSQNAAGFEGFRPTWPDSDAADIRDFEEDANVYKYATSTSFGGALLTRTLGVASPVVAFSVCREAQYFATELNRVLNDNEAVYHKPLAAEDAGEDMNQQEELDTPEDLLPCQRQCTPVRQSSSRLWIQLGVASVTLEDLMLRISNDWTGHPEWYSSLDDEVPSVLSVALHFDRWQRLRHGVAGVGQHRLFCFPKLTKRGSGLPAIVVPVVDDDIPETHDAGVIVAEQEHWGSVVIAKPQFWWWFPTDVRCDTLPYSRTAILALCPPNFSQWVTEACRHTGHDETHVAHAVSSCFEELVSTIYEQFTKYAYVRELVMAHLVATLPQHATQALARQKRREKKTVVEALPDDEDEREDVLLSLLQPLLLPVSLCDKDFWDKTNAKMTAHAQLAKYGLGAVKTRIWFVVAFHIPAHELIRLSRPPQGNLPLFDILSEGGS